MFHAFAHMWEEGANTCTEKEKVRLGPVKKTKMLLTVAVTGAKKERSIPLCTVSCLHNFPRATSVRDTLRFKEKKFEVENII